jgi:hypothetical protein
MLTHRETERGEAPVLFLKTAEQGRRPPTRGKAGLRLAGGGGAARELRGGEAHPKAVTAWREVAHGLLAACAVTRRGTAPTATALPRF